MSLDAFNVVRPLQKNQLSGGTGDVLELAIEEFTGEVEQVLARRSVLEGWLNIRPVKGTTTLTNYSVGDAGLQVLQPGVTPDGQDADFSKASVTIDTVILARHVLPLLDVFQTSFDARKELALAQGQRIAKFRDEAFFIQAIKAALLSASPYGSSGHLGGTTQNIAAADRQDPAAIYAALAGLFAQMEEKDVDPSQDDIVLVLRPTDFYALMQAEQIINGQYVTAAGTKQDGFIFKAFGVPVIRSNNFPAGKNITNHELSNTRNSNAYNGDFTDVVAAAFSPRALLAGETISLTSEVFYDQVSKSHYVDSFLSFGATPNRPEFAGVILEA
jgi:hypothetical protein